MFGKDNIFYVYAHRSICDGSLFYIGKGKGKRAYYTSNRSDKWRKLSLDGYEVEIVASGMTNDDALDLERLLVDEAIDSGYKLANQCRGGQGCSGFKHSQEHRERLSKNNPMHRSEIREKVSGDNSWMRKNGHKVAGWKQTDSARKKISESKIGKPRSPEMIEFLRQRQLNMDEAQKKRISESVKSIPKKTCPHCGKIGSHANMMRWHFDNCKLKPAR